MDQLPHPVRQELERILGRLPSELTPEEIGFLNARSWALNSHQREQYREVLTTSAPVPATAVPVTPEPVTPEPQAPVVTEPEPQPTQYTEPTPDPAPVAHEYQSEQPSQPLTPAQPETPAEVNPYDVNPEEVNNA